MSKISQVFTTLKTEGVGSTVWRSGRYLAEKVNPFRQTPGSTVFLEDVLEVDWTRETSFNSGSIPRPESGYRVAWVITPPGKTSGGHQNAFRFMDFLERSGNQLTIFLYQTAAKPAVSIEGIRQMMHETSAYPDLKAEMRVYRPEEGITGEYDAVFASDWETAYAVHRYPGKAKRFYFTQDFEPAFYPWGSDYVLAENTYRLGFHAISAGKWLSEKLQAEYGMTADYYDYAVDRQHYRITNTNKRSDVLFYARPPTPRRATEFGIMVLAELLRLRPHTRVHMVGWDMSSYNIPFKYINHRALDIAQLNAIYNQCAAGLVLSLTNMSLLPMEIMSSGVVPVVNDASNTRGVFDNSNIEFVPMSPRAMAEKIMQIIDRPDAIEHAQYIAESVAQMDWKDPGETFISTFEKAMTFPIPPVASGEVSKHKNGVEKN